MNTEFKLALEKILKDICGQLSGHEIPKKPWTRIINEGGGTTSLPQELRPDFSNLSSQLYQMLETFVSYEHLLDLVAGNALLANKLLKDAGGNPISERASQKSWLNRYVVVIILKYFSDAGSFIFDANIYNILYEKLVLELESNETNVRVISLLMNLEISSPEVVLSGSLRLRQLTPSELETWLNPGNFFMDRPLSIHELLGISCAMELQFKKTGSSFGYGGYDQDQIKQLLSSVRLVSNHDVHIALTQEDRVGVLSWGSAYSIGDIRRFVGQFKFDVEAEAQLKRVFDKLTTSVSLEHIKLALSRWDSATEKQNGHDKLIDYWIALESLFTPGSTSELQYRACVRIAAFIGTNAEERIEIYRIMRKSYKIRSTYVHPAKINNNDGEIIQKTREFLRAALLKIIDNPTLFKPENMEEEILRAFRSE